MLNIPEALSIQTRENHQNRLLSWLWALSFEQERYSLRNTLQNIQMGVSSKPRLSGMQKQVLALYRGFLRAAHSKSPEERSRIESMVSAEFRHNSTSVDRKNFLYIEYLLRRGKKQLDQLKSPDTVGLASLHVDVTRTKTS